MSRPQVRLDGDVAEALQAVVEREGVSLAHVVNSRLRSALGLRPAGKGQGPVGRAFARAATGRVGGDRCPHPIGRRIGDRCAVCGATVKAR